MTRLAALLLAVAALLPAQRAAQLDGVARVASVMVDGDVASRIVTKRALRYMLNDDPRDKWRAADNYDVNHEAFLQTKKTLIRLSRLVSFPCDVNLWLPLASDPPSIFLAVRNVHELSRFWRFGAMHQPMFPPMKRVLETGERVTVAGKGSLVAVLAPVYDSLGDIVGLVEVVARR